MTYEEASKALQYLISGESNQYPPDYDMAIRIAIEALEKQVPAVPYKVGIDEYECPIKFCRGKLTKGYPCKCGQIIDWSDEE